MFCPKKAPSSITGSKHYTSSITGSKHYTYIVTCNGIYQQHYMYSTTCNNTYQKQKHQAPCPPHSKQPPARQNKKMGSARPPKNKSAPWNVCRFCNGLKSEQRLQRLSVGVVWVLGECGAWVCRECILSLENVFSYQRMCCMGPGRMCYVGLQRIYSLTRECVLLLENVLYGSWKNVLYGL